MRHQIALIPGDGIGREVIPEGVRTLEVLAGDWTVFKSYFVEQRD
jgi:tartrate dehydrogenase/decarboxylase/D-malate dehydrogenase